MAADEWNPEGLPVFMPADQCGVHFSDSAGPIKLYGAVLDQQLEARLAASRMGKRRRTTNLVAALAALLLPWAAFVTVFAAVSFYPHYAAPVTVTAGSLLATAACGALAASAAMAWKAGSDSRFLRVYLGLALTLSCAAGWVVGDINFWQFMQPAYHIDHLATYTNVNPSSQHLWSGGRAPVNGDRFQDAGKIFFSHRAVVDTRRSAGFRDGKLYCVAPIVDPACQDNCGYDFWAVGIDCCSGLAADFRCGASSSATARSGLRQVVETWRPFYRLAVMQAEGIHGISSKHPLFFHWVEDPVAELRMWKIAGYRTLVVAIVLSFLANAAVLVPVLKEARVLAA